MPEVVPMTPGKTDADLAEEYRNAFRELLRKIAALMDKARTDGLAVTFNIAPDQYGKHVVNTIAIVKPL